MAADRMVIHGAQVSETQAHTVPFLTDERRLACEHRRVHRQRVEPSFRSDQDVRFPP